MFGRAHNSHGWSFPGLISGMLALAAILGACSGPQQIETFIKSGKRGAEPAYRFTLNMSDSLRLYDIAFYTRIDCPEEVFVTLPAEIPLEIVLTAPSGQKYSETVSFPRDGYLHGSYFTRQYEVGWRTGLRPVEYGLWTMDVTVLGEEKFRGLRGMGVVFRRQDSRRAG